MISIIVPVYKVETYLQQCIDSIVMQTYRDIEILLIDDGSTDNCGEICDKYAENDTRIRVFHTENRGLSAARNVGLREAKGEYIGFVDSDDWIEPEMYEKMLRTLEETDADICCCGYWREWSGDVKLFVPEQMTLYGDDAVRGLILETIGVYAWDKLYKKEIFSSIEFLEGHTFEDLYILYKIFLQIRKVACLPIPLYHYRQRASSIVWDRSIRNQLDCWQANHERYLYFNSDEKYKNDRVIIDRLVQKCASSASSIWMCAYANKEWEDYKKQLKEISGFVRKNVPVFGIKGWSKAVRFETFMARRTSRCVLFLSFNIYRIYLKYIHKYIHPSYREKSPYP